MIELLDQIEARANAASEGPWKACMDSDGGIDVGFDPDGIFTIYAGFGWDDDAEFIANARTDIERLLAAVRAVEEAISDIEIDARFVSDWEDGRVALAAEIRVAIDEALEGEG